MGKRGAPGSSDLSTLALSLPSSVLSCGQRESEAWGQVGMG